MTARSLVQRSCVLAGLLVLSGFLFYIGKGHTVLLDTAAVTVDGHAIPYTATAGTLTLRDDEGKPVASMFYVAYTADGGGKARPVTFLYNGGPGSSAVWLHMASLAPVRVEATLLEAGGKADVERAIREAMAAGDSVGGLVECRVLGLPAGLGEPFFDSVESLLAHAAFAIPAIKGIEFGDGFPACARRGSEVNDPILDMEGHTATNHAGGINGGLTNGNELVFRVGVKPTSSIKAPQTTLDLRTHEPAELRIGGRHDACIALRVPVVLEAVTAAVLADLMLQDGRLARVGVRP